MLCTGSIESCERDAAITSHDLSETQVETTSDGRLLMNLQVKAPIEVVSCGNRHALLDRQRRL